MDPERSNMKIVVKLKLTKEITVEDYNSSSEDKYLKKLNNGWKN